jgi:hypothetical protein
MVAPWLHYEAYGIRFVNNIVYNVAGAGMGVHGGYNVLLAYNTLCRVGLGARQSYPGQPPDPRAGAPRERRIEGWIPPVEVNYGSHVVEVGYGNRICDGLEDNDAEVRRQAQDACDRYRNRRGWGSSDSPDDIEGIPNYRVLIYNNVIYNPDGEASRHQHLWVPADMSSPAPLYLPSATTQADEELYLQGNLIWNELPPAVPPAARLYGGMNHGSAILAANTIHDVHDNNEPQVLRNPRPPRPPGDPTAGPNVDNFRPAPGGALFASPRAVRIPDFTWSERPDSHLPDVSPANPPVPGEPTLAPIPPDGLRNDPWGGGFFVPFRGILFDFGRACREQGGLIGAFKE